MRIAESLRTGTLEIFHHKMRSFLTFFSISIGVISILYSLTLIYSMNFRTRKALEAAGPGRIVIKMKERWRAESDIEKKQARDSLTLEDALAVEKQFPELYMVSPTLRKWIEFRAGAFTEWQGVMGITPKWKNRGWVYKVHGRFLNQHDIDTNARVCVIIRKGGWIKKPRWVKFYEWKDRFQEYVKHNDLLGKAIKLGDNIYTVVGVLEEPPLEKNPRTFLDIGDWMPTVMAPVTTVQRFVAGWANSDGIDEINVDTGKESTINSYKIKIQKLIAARHGGRTHFLEIKDFREIIKDKLASKQRDMYTVLIIGIIAILAGGVGIMNVTLATIYSRIKEIGIRRAIGAARSDIMAQFIIEAMLLGFFGGVAGILVGMTGIQYLASKGDSDMMMFQWWMPFISILAAVFTGFIAAVYPAYQASKLDPVEALRYE
ncbi:MAG: ABC transporter permease [Elusimicrobia bacterium]|nr:ABC transporter permease [Elusimicrobiota bacterium]